MKKIFVLVFISFSMLFLTACEIKDKIDDHLININEITASNADSLTATKGTIIGITSSGYLITDSTGSIFVYQNNTTDFAIGDEISVSGQVTMTHSTLVFDQTSEITRLSSETYEEDSESVILDQSLISSNLENVQVGLYVTLTGTLNFSNEVYDIDGIVLEIDTSISIEASLISQDVTIFGYILNVEDDLTLHILTQDIELTTESMLIGDVLDAPVDQTYLSEGVIVDTTNNGVLITDYLDYIFVETSEIPQFASGDYIKVQGPTAFKNHTVVFTTDTVITKTASNTYENPATALFKYGQELDEYQETVMVGQYISFQGDIFIDQNQAFVTIENTQIIVEIQGTAYDYSNYENKNVNLTGYVLNYNDVEETHYLNVLITEIEENILPEDITLSIFSINDLHGYIEQDEYGQGGISNTAYLINTLRDQVDENVLIANGDMFQGTAISNMTQGQSVIDIMNMMSFDVMGIGNHEFDWELETILSYFDGDTSNGEANFPLLNANIYNVDDDSLVTVIDGHVFSSYLVHKDYVDVGVISYVGDVYDSIAYTQVQNYYFDLDIASSVYDLSTSLRLNGADIVVVNIHGGASSNISNYGYNQEIAELKDAQGDYLVDVVINGHTHSYQTGTISRPSGQPLLLVQAGGNNGAFGKIDFTIHTEDMSITDYNVDLVYVSSAGTTYDADIENYITSVNDSLGTTNLVMSNETIEYRSQLYDWVANVIAAGTGADLAISNTGGIRSTANIYSGEYVTVAQMYEVFPFDNTVYIFEATYDELEELLSSSSIHYSFAEGVTDSSQDTYKVAMTSYVYFWDQMIDVHGDEDIDTGVYVRDLLIKDLTAKGEQNIMFEPSSHPEATITNQLDDYLMYVPIAEYYVVNKNSIFHTYL
jgi:2',3'-cyclic-nucleotide 2'-phosphodiesterase (5'-nucleotidase family)